MIIMIIIKMWQPQFKYFHRWLGKMLWYEDSSKWFLQVPVHPGRGVLPLHHVHVQRLLCPDRHGHRHPRLQVHRAQGVSFSSSLPRGTWHLLSLISSSRGEYYQTSPRASGFRLQTDHTGRTLIPCWNVQSTCLIRPVPDKNNVGDVGDDYNE